MPQLCRSAARVAAVSLLALVPYGAVRADELSDLKKLTETLMKRIEQLETKQRELEKTAATAQQAPSSAGAPTTVVGLPAGTPPTQAKPGTPAPAGGTATAAAAPPADAVYVEKGAFPGSLKIPGTNTSIKLGGYVKFDAIYDVNAPLGDFIVPPAIPLRTGVTGSATFAERRDGSTRFTARQTRVNLETRTPDSPFGPIRSLIEGDFYGAGSGTTTLSNSYNFRLRHAFIWTGPLGFGQYWSNFQDNDAFYDTIDFNGPTGQVFIRQPQIRYTHPIDPRNSFSVSLENPSGDFFGANVNTAGINSVPSTNSREPAPDITGYFDHRGDFGHVRLSAVGRYLLFDNGNPAGNRPDYFGYGIQLSGHFGGFLGKDRINYSLLGGQGIGRYFNDNGSAGGAAALGIISPAPIGLTSPPAADLVPIASYGGFVDFQHWWLDNLRTNVVYGYQFNDNPRRNGAFISPGSLNQEFQTVHVNLLWNPFERAEFGIEYIYGYRRTNIDQTGDISRIQAAAKYSF